MLESRRLYFVPWEKSDFKVLKKTLGNPKVCEYLPGKNQKSDEEIQKWLDFYVSSFNDDLGNKIFKVLNKQTGEVIGYGGLGFVKEFDEIEIMYGFDVKHWGLGYATEVSNKLKEYAKKIGLKYVIALADVGNIGSAKVLEKTGFKQIKEVEMWGLDLYFYEMDL